MLLFSKGDYKFVLLLLQDFATLSKASGLAANVAKSALYSCNMENDDIVWLCATSGIGLGRLPSNYLGMTIFAKKLCVADCALLVEKITARLRCWGQGISRMLEDVNL